jgi:hypothetical protein
MAVPRPVLLALLGLALCAAAFLATRGAQEPGGAVTASPVATPAAPAAPAAKPDRPASKPEQREHAAPSKPSAGDDAKDAAPNAPKTAAPPTEIGEAIGTEAKAQIVRAAYDRGDVIVFFFSHPGAADDTGTRQAVKALRGVDRVTIVRADLDDLTTYRPVLSSAGVSQVPAVVVARDGKSARLLEGYVDGRSLRQTVADALR